MRNWWRAKPWQVWPLSRAGWRYHRIYRLARQGSKHPRTGRWLAGGEPLGRLASLRAAVVFPHVHDEDEL